MQIKTSGNKEQRTNEMQTAPPHLQSRRGENSPCHMGTPTHTHTHIYTLSFTLAAQRHELTEMVLTREDGTEVMGGQLQYVQ